MLLCCSFKFSFSAYKTEYPSHILKTYFFLIFLCLLITNHGIFYYFYKGFGLLTQRSLKVPVHYDNVLLLRIYSGNIKLCSVPFDFAHSIFSFFFSFHVLSCQTTNLFMYCLEFYSQLEICSFHRTKREFTAGFQFSFSVLWFQLI